MTVASEARLSVVLDLVDRASGQMKEFQGALQAHAKEIKAVGMAATAMGGAILGSVALSVRSYAKLGDEIHDMALRTGFSAQALSELKHAADLSGASLGTVEMAVKRASVALIAAGDGSAEAQRSFVKLGLSVNDLIDMKPEEQFFAIANALAGVDDQATRTALAVDLFGRSGTELLPMLSEGAAGLDAMRAEARRLGITISDEAAAKADQFSDDLVRLKASLTGAMMTVGSMLVPALMSLAEKVTAVIVGVRRWMEAHPGLAKVLTATAVAIGLVASSGGAVLLMLPSLIAGMAALGAATHLALGPLGLITAGLTLAMAAAIYFAGRNKDAGKSLGSVEQAAQVTMTTLEEYTGRQQKAAEAAQDAARRKGALASSINRVTESLSTEQAALDLANKKVDEAKVAYENAQQSAGGYKAALDAVTGELARNKTALDLAKLDLTDMQARYKTMADNSAGYKTELMDLTAKVRDHEVALRAAKEKLTVIQQSYDAAKTAVAGFQEKIADANRELQGLSAPRLEGMQAYEDQIFAVGQAIKALQLQAKQAPEGFDTAEVNKQIAALEKQRDILILTRDVKFDPLTRQARESAEAIQGLNAEFAPEAVMKRIAELGKALGPDGELGKGLAEAQKTLATQTVAFNEQATAVEKLGKETQGYQAALDNLNKTIADALEAQKAEITNQEKLVAGLQRNTEASQAALNLLNQEIEKVLASFDEQVQKAENSKKAIEDMVANSNERLISLKAQMDGTWDKFIADAKAAKALLDSIQSRGTPSVGPPVLAPGGWGGETPAQVFTPSPYPPGFEFLSYQHGGIITRPTLAMIGEKGPEAVVPLNKSMGLTINFNAPIYAMAEFEEAVARAVKNAKLRGGFHGLKFGAGV